MFRALLEGARLGAQFPDATKWQALCDVLARGGPRGKPLRILTSAQSGLITPRSLTHLHRLQLVAREFFKTMRAKPSKEARAFSMALAALELPPVSSTRARLVSRASDSVRFQVVHEQLGATAVRLTLTVDQKGRGPISLGRDQLAACSEKFCRTLSLSADSATTAWFGVGDASLSVVEVTRGELGPFLPLATSSDPCARALSPLCGIDGAILERDVAAARSRRREDHRARHVGVRSPGTSGSAPRARAAALRDAGARREGEGARRHPNADPRCRLTR
ncbi:MAG: hypothetical protein QM817_26185 [Archangium sp.]